MITHAEALRSLVTISVGVNSTKPRKDQTAADLVETADIALYAAKRRGRSMVVTAPALLSMAS